MSEIKRKTGEIAALLLALWLGLGAMTASHLWSVATPVEANQILLKIGSWLPAWWGIGPYAGKETIGLVVWLVSWGVLHLALRNVEVSLQKWVYGFVAGFAVLLVVLWPPVYHAVFGWNAPLAG